MNVLSLFDGMSCGQISLSNLGIKVDNYFASEIKKHAIFCTQTNFPNIIQLGDVRNIKAKDLPEIDLLIGGSPCQDFSFANKVNKGLEGEKSILFFEYLRLLEEIKPKYFLLENVYMSSDNYNQLTRYMGIEPIRLNGALVSAALRDRYYWTNIGPITYDLFGNPRSVMPSPTDKGIILNDVLDYGYSKRKKHTCLKTCFGGRSQKSMIKRMKVVGMETQIYTDSAMDISKGLRYANQNEIERFHNIPAGYTSMLNMRKAQDLIGDGWTIGIIDHIFSYLI